MTTNREPRSAQRKASSGIFAMLILTMVAVSFSAPAGAQEQCSHGVIRLPAGINGTIEICPDIASQAPELQRQLSDIRKSLANQDQQMRELKRLIEGLNSVSQNIGLNRQGEFVQHLSQQLDAIRSGGPQQTQKQMADLEDRVDSLQNLLVEKLGDRGTADRANAAIDGPVGDAIAQLDLSKAYSLLEDIRVQLKVIDSKVDGVRKDTTEINKKLDQRQAAEEQREKIEEEQRRLAAEAAKKAEIEKESDPDNFTRVQIIARLQPDPTATPDSSWSYSFYFSSLPPLYLPYPDAALSIAFHNRAGEAWVVTPTDRTVATQGEVWKMNAADIGDKATVCFSALSKKTGQRRQWTQRYTVRQNAIGNASLASFNPDGDATLAPAGGGPCDGVTEVRRPLTIVRKTPQQLQAEQDAKQKEILAETKKERDSNPSTFARIWVSATKKQFDNNGKWQLKVTTGPLGGATTFYDMSVQISMKLSDNRKWPVQLSNREIFSTLENRYASLDRLGTEAVVCFTARDPRRDQPMRLTQWFTVETSQMSYGEQAAFVAAKPPTLTPASNAPCQ